MKKRLIAACLSLIFLFGAAEILSAGAPAELTVSAAISLKDAFEAIGRAYETEGGGSRVFFNFGASGDLAQQIAGGAPVDVFVSAAQKDMDVLDGKGLVVRATRADFAANRIVLIIPAGTKGSPASFDRLAAHGTGKIAIGNPKTVPAGRYAEDVLKHYALLAAVRDKLILAGNVRQVLDYVSRAEVDAGIVYATDAAARAKEVRVVAVAPKESHRPVVYPIAVVRGTGNEGAARAFIAFVRSAEGRKILAKYGFGEVL